MIEEKNNSRQSFLLKYRYYIMGLSILLFLPPLSLLFQLTGDHNFCGTWCPRMFFVWRDNSTIASYFIGFLRSYMGVILVASALISTFLFSRFWCGYLCPIGATTELGAKLVPNFMKIDYSKVPAPSFRYGYLAAYLGAAALGVGSLCCSYCNFATIPRLFGTIFFNADFAYFLRTTGLINLGLIFLLGFMAKGGRAYCNIMCPIGAMDALSNRIGERFGRRVVIHPTRCVSCGQCASVCPAWAINTNEKTIDQLSCIFCRKCEQTCLHNSIGYEKAHKGSMEIEIKTNETV
jgi:polyferredoxin